MKAIFFFFISTISLDTFASNRQILLRLQIKALGLNNNSTLYVESDYNGDGGSNLKKAIELFDYENHPLNIFRKFAPSSKDLVLISKEDTEGLVGTDVFKIRFEDGFYSESKQRDIYPLEVKFRTEMGLSKVFRKITGQIYRDQFSDTWVPYAEGASFKKIYCKVGLDLKIREIQLIKNGKTVKTIKVNNLKKIKESEF